MVRNLNIVNGRPPTPHRRAQYSTGPGSAQYTLQAATANTGISSSSPTAAATMSNSRFAMPGTSLHKTHTPDLHLPPGAPARSGAAV